LFLAVLPLLLLIFWVVRIRFTNVLKRMPVGRKRDVYSLPAQTSSSLDSAWRLEDRSGGQENGNERHGCRGTLGSRTIMKLKR